MASFFEAFKTMFFSYLLYFQFFMICLCFLKLGSFVQFESKDFTDYTDLYKQVYHTLGSFRFLGP